MALRLKQTPLAELKPARYNPRKISKHEFEALKRSLAEYGAVEPAVVNADGTIVGGHMRVRAAKELGWSEFPVVRVDVPADKAKLLNLALNRISGEWEQESLATLLADLDSSSADLTLSGFKASELEHLLASVNGNGTAPDPIDPPVEPKTKPGDLWLLGEHRLLCGDATKEADVSRLLDGERAQAVVTDPPYGIGLEYGENTDDTQAALRVLVDAFLPLAMDNADVVALSCGIANERLYPAPDWVLCWWYGGGASWSRWGFNCWQPILVYGRDPYLAAGMGSRPDGVNSNVSAQGAGKELGHPAPKPMPVWTWLVERVTTKRGALVLDPFCGSGTTLIVAEQLGRRCYALEIEPRHCDVIVNRWERHTGQKAKLDG